jgi:hypothetical protein
MSSRSLPISGPLARALALACAALAASAMLFASAAQATTRLTIASPSGARVSGTVRFSARGFGPGVRTVLFEIDGRRAFTASLRPFRPSGWLNTRKLGNGAHLLAVKVFYARRVRTARKRITVHNAVKPQPAKHELHLAKPAATTTPPPASAPATPPDTTALSDAWRAAGSNGIFTPLSDATAATAVVAAPETRPTNAAANQDVPTSAQLQAFRSALDPWGRTPVQANPYYAYVTGDFTGSTDEIIQWAAAKWGVPVDWLRAEYMHESRWCDSQLGDLATVTPTVYSEYPPQARVPGTDEVYESMGISQVKWIPDGSVGAGTEPLRWESTAFNVDYQAANVRFYYDDPNGVRASWRDPSYQAGQAWNSIGGWYNPYPWGNSGQLSYVQQVQQQLVNRTWTETPRTPACS